MLGSTIARERTKLAKAVAIVMIVFAIALPALGIFYLTNVPIALKSTATNDVVHFGMKKAILKSLMLFAGYEVLYIVGAVQGLRRRASI
jgi:hypothetical protein